MKDLPGLYRDRCKKVLTVMRCLVGTEWGEEGVGLRTIDWIDKVNIRLWMCSVSVCSRQSSQTDLIQYQAFLRSTQTSALQIEMGKMPLDLLSYWVNVQGHKQVILHWMFGCIKKGKGQGKFWMDSRTER